MPKLRRWRHRGGRSPQLYNLPAREGAILRCWSLRRLSAWKVQCDRIILPGVLPRLPCSQQERVSVHAVPCGDQGTSRWCLCTLPAWLLLRCSRVNELRGMPDGLGQQRKCHQLLPLPRRDAAGSVHADLPPVPCGQVVGRKCHFLLPMRTRLLRTGRRLERVHQLRSWLSSHFELHGVLYVRGGQVRHARSGDVLCLSCGQDQQGRKRELHRVLRWARPAIDQGRLYPLRTRPSRALGLQLDELSAVPGGNRAKCQPHRLRALRRRQGGCHGRQQPVQQLPCWRSAQRGSHGLYCMPHRMGCQRRSCTLHSLPGGDVRGRLENDLHCLRVRHFQCARRCQLHPVWARQGGRRERDRLGMPQVPSRHEQVVCDLVRAVLGGSFCARRSRHVHPLLDRDGATKWNLWFWGQIGSRLRAVREA